ncbi:hypothetical protein BDV38DRAFT_287777 [Aspergillus pseudotamarii]|uniref:Delta(24)-sterol reductase n=1 Tax=Aspergillus pseudotamarii TaxID=132259 RepID=A0A5N6SEL7_ASPPS|nr:uncharacterized protein BDV38DRAFT_287777 [Aspergillus pseudotamarii]KAE8132377.1 hypothetical protein BDV38DRAFT_287777 [Aspergillus pseudotamarii]
MDSHNAIVQQVSARVKKFHDDKKPFYIYHGFTNNLTRPSKKSTSNTIDPSGPNRVLGIDRTRKVALVERNTPIDMLVNAILPHGFIPPVVMEYPGITVGGGLAGRPGESSSYEYGFFDRTISWIEIVIGNGEVLHALPTDNSELFIGAACSFGTLGIATLLEL